MNRALLLLVPLVLIGCLVPIGCRGSGNDAEESLLTEKQQAELTKIVNRRLAEVGQEVSLSESQLESIKPALRIAKNKLIKASRKFREDPTGSNIDKYQRQAREIGIELRKNLQPFMTNSQLNQFMVVIDRVIQDVRARRRA